MPYRSKIETIEHEIKELSKILCKALVPLDEPHPYFLVSLNMMFERDDYLEAIASLKWALEDNRLILPDTAQPIWTDILIKADRALDLYRSERQDDEGFKDPITHMNVLAANDEDTPNDFGKRYNLSASDVKSLQLISPGFEERFIRRRIADSAARGAARYGQCLYAKKRYELTKEQAERLVDDMWENPNTVSKVFHELLSPEELLQCRLNEEHQERVLQIRANYNI